MIQAAQNTGVLRGGGGEQVPAYRRRDVALFTVGRAPRRRERERESVACSGPGRRDAMKILSNFASKEDNNNNNNNNVDDNLRDNPTSKLFSVSRVTPSLFLCGAPAVREDVLVDLGVGCVVSAAPELPPPPLPPQVALVLRLPLKDLPSEDLLSRLHTTVDNIHQVIEDGGRVLVHCVAGVSRSAAIVLAYLVKHQGLSLRAAFAHLRACRPAVRPNTGFFRQLIEFEQQTTDCTTVEMVYNPAARTHIPDVYEPDYQNTLCFLNNRNFGKH